MLNTKQNSMTMTTKSTYVAVKSSQFVAGGVLALTLVACGDSDLEQIQQDRIEAAVLEAEESDQLVIGAGLPEEADQEATGAELAEETDQVTTGAGLPEETDQEATGAGIAEETEEAATGTGLPEETSEIPAPSEATRSAIDVDEFDLVFNDEFNALELDATKWNTAMAWGTDLVINDEQQFYVDAQSNPNSEFNPFSFDGESLIISADATPDSMIGVVNEQNFVSGALTTLGKYDLSYGYIEARIDVPEGVGLWPSLWMLGTEFVDLKPQLYIMEFNGGNRDSFFHNYNYTDQEGNLRSPSQHEVVVNGASEGFHTIGLRWSEGELIYYINGFPTFQVNGENVPSQAMYLIMNLAVGGIWVDEPDATTGLPASVKVDYIRAYQSK